MTTYSIELELTPDLLGVYDTMVLDVHIEMEIETHPTRPSGEYGPPEYYDPGSPAEWRFVECNIHFPSRTKPDGTKVPVPHLRLDTFQFEAFFGPAAEQLWENAQEDASDNYDSMDYAPEEW